MSKLINGKEAKLAWANGVEIEFYSEDLKEWFLVDGETFTNVFDKRKCRIKPKTIKLSNIEVPAPFKPKAGEKVWFLNDDCKCGYGYSEDYDEDAYSIFGWWRTEAEIKQVVEAIKRVFKPQ